MLGLVSLICGVFVWLTIGEPTPMLIAVAFLTAAVWLYFIVSWKPTVTLVAELVANIWLIIWMISLYR